jgi:hypothetical protein
MLGLEVQGSPWNYRQQKGIQEGRRAESKALRQEWSRI